MSTFETIIYQKDGAIARITLNRPRFLNAHNIQMRDDLAEVLSAIADDTEVGVVIINGAGRAFCAGADITEFGLAPSRVIARDVRWERDIWGMFLHLEQPLIAAVHGFALGGGIEMALCCDIRIATEDARFGLPEVGLGMIPAGGATQTLPRVVGIGRALQLLLTAQFIDAQEALRWGLVHRVVPRDELMPTAEEVAQRLLSYDQRAVRAAKRAVTQGLNLPLTLGLELEARLGQMLQRPTADLPGN